MIGLTNYRIRRLRLSRLLLVQEARHPSPRIIRTLGDGFVIRDQGDDRLFGSSCRPTRVGVRDPKGIRGDIRQVGR